MALSKQAIEMLKQKMLKWDNRHPIDVAWRKHFNIPFGSKQHLEASLFEQQIWFEEFKELKKLDDQHNQHTDHYSPDSPDSPEGDLKPKGVKKLPSELALKHLPPDTVSEVPMSQKEIEEAFNNLNIEELQKQEDARSGGK